jgi:hypothetical protein
MQRGDGTNSSARQAIASIFVNPTQFLPHEDLARYPRDLPGDLSKLRTVDCDFVFAPSAEEMYPAKQGVYVTVDAAEATAEGGPTWQPATRPRRSRPPQDACGLDTSEGWPQSAVSCSTLCGPTGPSSVHRTRVRQQRGSAQAARAGQKDGMQCIVIKQLVSHALVVAAETRP